MASLHAAWNAGIRHFDVAPMYGYGAAESCLGEFLKGVPVGQATVTTKYGIAPQAGRSLVGVARTLVKPVIRLLPGVKRRLALAAARVTPKVERPAFLPGPAGESLERSLRALRLEHIDLWLLHEVQAGDLAGAGGEALLRFLEETVASGKIGGFGIGSGSNKVPALVAEHPTFCRIRQYDWSVLDPLPPDDGAFRIHHRALTENFRALHAALKGCPEIAKSWSEKTGVDLRQKGTLAQMMLAAALVMNPESVILFSSKDPAHVEANATLAQGTADGMAVAAQTFYALVQSEGVALLHPGKIKPDRLDAGRARV